MSDALYLEDYAALAERELRVDVGRLVEETANIAYLHGRWMQFYDTEKKALRRMKREVAKMYQKRWNHFRGVGDPNDFPNEKPPDLILDTTKTGKKKTASHTPVTVVEMYLEADDLYQDLKDKMEDQETLLEYLQQCLKMIAFRRNQIDAINETRKFEFGR